MSRPFMRQTALCVAILLASACSVQRVDEAAARAEATAETAGQYAAIQRNKQQQERRDTVIFSDKLWVSTQPVVARRGIADGFMFDQRSLPTRRVAVSVHNVVATQLAPFRCLLAVRLS
ncbi:Type II and III secretion system protein [Pseudomonas syringae pv. maculicola]|nr:Type II and III secretion system protein [Pseudomonas syringae pv. maculicola]